MLVFALAGCAKKTTAKILIKDYLNFASFKFPKGTNGRISDDYLYVELSKYGEFDVVINTDDGKSCHIHLTHQKEGSSVTSEDIKDLVVEWE